ncbi:GMC oxidoreductase [Arthrobacter sp. ISL-72]|uniref:GMC oxidoreductase n=1 Tax=Arthrobacter sp. ISL-72 TaxID=2819114 RepID=UPI001BE67C32|nr:GMC family oxidoreductase [Arthrobacter sp. ISL-72]MBT2595464.1 GMC family oxidoreductase [Arthrobacter sp. ISL-72]
MEPVVNGGDDPAESVDAVVVGSGFGGSVASYRLAAGGQSVVLMERGKAYPPGSFARTPSEMGRNFWDPDRGLYGLFDAWTFRGLEGIVSSGLGGGSLIYANVLLRKDENWFVQESPVPGGGYESWPFSRQDLDPYYDAAEAMLRPVPYPYQDTPKTLAMETAARALGLSITRPPIAVTFSPKPGAAPVRNHVLPPAPYGSVHGEGAVRTTCTLSGECDIGCNAGAKNTLDHNYISAAKAAGADIRTHHDVRGIRPLAAGGYEVRYVIHDPADATPGLLREQVIHCRRLILGAGAFGTTFLLLRNRASLPALSPALGTRFSGNGDLLGFVLDAKDPDGITRTLSGSIGPVITTAIRTADSTDGGEGRGYYIEDAGYPSFMNWLLETGQFRQVAKRAGKVMVQLLKDRLFQAQRSNISADLAAALGDGRLSASSVPLLGMGRDIPDGVMTLQGGRLAINWTLATSASYFGRMQATMHAIAEELGGSFKQNPLWWSKRVITVHPLGGAPAGRNSSEGVCDSFGEVFGYPGLYVVDGAVMPGPVGANPALTIAAFAERTCDRILNGRAGDNQRGGLDSANLPNRNADGGTGDGGTAEYAVAPPRALVPDATKGAKAPEEERIFGPRAAGRALGVPGAVGPSAVGLPAVGVPAVGMPASEALQEAQIEEEAEAAATGPTSVSFTEQMHGWFSAGVADPETGRSLGRDRSRRMMFELTITAPDIDVFVRDPLHPAAAEGYVLADQFGGRLPVERGWFNLFVQDGFVQDGGPDGVGKADGAAGRKMLYRLWLRDPGGTPLTFVGHKDIRNDPGLDVWGDTTTLYVTVLRGHVPPPDHTPDPDHTPRPDPTTEAPMSFRPDTGTSGALSSRYVDKNPVAGAGMLYIRPWDFARQLTTFRAVGPAPASALAAFGKLFLGELWQVYGRPANRGSANRGSVHRGSANRRSVHRGTAHRGSAGKVSGRQ